MSDVKTILDNTNDISLFSRTPMTNVLDDKTLAKRGMRKLTVEEVSRVLLDSFKEDVNGTVIMVFPDLPPVRVPNFNNFLFYLFPVFKLHQALFPQGTFIEALRMLTLALLSMLFLAFALGMGAHGLLF